MVYAETMIIKSNQLPELTPRKRRARYRPDPNSKKSARRSVARKPLYDVTNLNMLKAALTSATNRDAPLERIRHLKFLIAQEEAHLKLIWAAQRKRINARHYSKSKRAMKARSKKFREEHPDYFRDRRARIKKEQAYNPLNFEHTTDTKIEISPMNPEFSSQVKPKDSPG